MPGRWAKPTRCGGSLERLLEEDWHPANRHGLIDDD
jgi:hypothetical protein